MLRRNIILIFLLTTFRCSYGNNTVILSDSSKISLITCSSGSDLYNAFGHSAVRINDSRLNMDITFSYGAYDFSRSNFTKDFLTGNLDFMLIIEMTEDFLIAYISENRDITEVEIKLTQKQKQTVFDYLLWNAELGNRNYQYDFFSNNCATKIRDVFETLFNNEKILNYEMGRFENKLTTREILNKYLRSYTWASLVVNLITGYEYDKTPAPNMQTFLPRYLEVAFLNGLDGKTTYISNRVNVINQAVSEDANGFGLNRPNVILPFILFVAFIVGYVFKARGIFITTTIVCLLIGIIGLLILWLQHALNLKFMNANLLWSLPGILFGINLILYRNKKERIVRTMRIYGLYLAAILFVIWFLPQSIPTSVIICILVVGVGLLSFSVVMKTN